MNLERAKEIFTELSAIIEPHCERVDVAGSVRREKEYPKDIEVLCLPKGRSGRTRIGTELMQSGYRIHKGKFTGRYVKLIHPAGASIDFFMPQEHDYIRQLVIRTGSANFSHEVAKAWVKKGYQGCEDGLRRNEFGKNGKLAPEFETEQDFFEWLGMEWVEPKDRI